MRRHLVTLALVVAVIMLVVLLLTPLVWILMEDRSAWPSCDLDPTPPCLE